MAFATYWLMAFAIELVSSLGSYFSDFKTAFFFTIFGLVAAQVRFSARVYIITAALAALLLTMAVIWTEIKPEYRRFVSGGQAAQVVTVGFGERVSKLGELVVQHGRGGVLGWCGHTDRKIGLHRLLRCGHRSCAKRGAVSRRGNLVGCDHSSLHAAHTLSGKICN